MSATNKALVRRLVDDAVNQRDPSVLAEVAAGRFVKRARAWVDPFRQSFPDFVELIAGGDRVVGHFRCSGTYEGDWLGHAATGRRFVDVDEIYVFTVRDGRLVDAVGVEDNLARLRQLGLR
jgi:predicted ester cyclase